MRIFGIPRDLWTTDLFSGLVNISQDTILLKDLSAAKIKVVGGFINSFLQIHAQRGPMVVRIVVDSVNISAYDIYEKRSYAQVVVNGKRVLAGWRGAKGPSTIDRGNVSSSGVIKVKNQNLSSEIRGLENNRVCSDVIMEDKFASHPPAVSLKYSNTCISTGLRCLLFILRTISISQKRWTTPDIGHVAQNLWSEVDMLRFQKDMS